jgi:hypothetical protein
MVRIGVLHPDLGLGGAERLIIDVALGLQKQGHEVLLFTSYHDSSRCFAETRDGTVGLIDLDSQRHRLDSSQSHGSMDSSAYPWEVSCSHGLDQNDICRLMRSLGIWTVFRCFLHRCSFCLHSSSETEQSKSKNLFGFLRSDSLD